MFTSTKDGTCLQELLRIAIPFCQQAEREAPRQGPGRRPIVPDWVIAVMIAIAVLKLRKAKSSQYRFLEAHQAELAKLLPIPSFPARSSFLARYKRAWKLLEVAIRLAGQHAVQQRFVWPSCVAVDKSVVPARGPKWNRGHVARNKVPRGADLDATWTRSQHNGWQLGYGFEVVVSAEKTGAVWPLLASAGPASSQPPRTFPEKIPHLPAQTRYVLADSGYDSNDLAEAVEENAGRPGVRRLLCPYPEHRGGTTTQHKENRTRKQRRLRRRVRHEFLQRPFAKRLLRRRGTKVEPFNEWLKSRFDLHQQAWHRGLANNQTQILAAIFAYQVLLLYNHACGHQNGCIQWILDLL